MDEVIVIEGTYCPCDYCGVKTGCMPLGKDGAWVCKPCAFKLENMQTTQRQISKIINELEAASPGTVKSNQAN